MEDLVKYNMVSSLRISELTGKPHRHVLRDIRRMLPDMNINPCDYESEYTSLQDKILPCYRLPSFVAAAIICRYDIRTSLKLFKDSQEVIDALNNFEIPKDLPDMYVYAIREVDTGNIKLGISKNPKSRLKQLQTGNSSKLELVAYKKADNRYQDEISLHNKNRDNHIIGEWFSCYDESELNPCLDML